MTISRISSKRCRAWINSQGKHCLEEAKGQNAMVISTDDMDSWITNYTFIPFQDHKLPKFHHFCTFQFKGKLRIRSSWIHKEHPRTIKNKLNHQKHIDLWCQTFSWQAAWWWSQPAAGPVAWHCQHRSGTPQLPVCKGKPTCSTRKNQPIMDVNANSRK